MNERDRCALVIVDARYEGTSVAPAGRSPIAWVWEGWPTARVVKIDERPRRSTALIATWIIPPCDVAASSGFGTDVPLAGQSKGCCPLDALGTAFARNVWNFPAARWTPCFSTCDSDGVPCDGTRRSAPRHCWRSPSGSVAPARSWAA